MRDSIIAGEFAAFRKKVHEVYPEDLEAKPVAVHDGGRMAPAGPKPAATAPTRAQPKQGAPGAGRKPAYPRKK